MPGSYLRLQCSGRYVCVLFRNDIIDDGLVLCRLIILLVHQQDIFAIFHTFRNMSQEELMVLLDKYLTHLTNLKGELTEKDGNLSEVSGAARTQDRLLISDMLGVHNYIGFNIQETWKKFKREFDLSLCETDKVSNGLVKRGLWPLIIEFVVLFVYMLGVWLSAGIDQVWCFSRVCGECSKTCSQGESRPAGHSIAVQGGTAASLEGSHS